jgi:hypothetical protein
MPLWVEVVMAPRKATRCLCEVVSPIEYRQSVSPCRSLHRSTGRASGTLRQCHPGADHFQQPVECCMHGVAAPWRGCFAPVRWNVPAVEPNDSFTIETSLAKPLPEVLSSKDILMHGIEPVPNAQPGTQQTSPEQERSGSGEFAVAHEHGGIDPLTWTASFLPQGLRKTP